MSLTAVVLEKYEQPPPEKLAALLQAICGQSRIDALQRARRAKGILIDDLPPEQAEPLCAALTRIGWPARMVPAARVRNFRCSRVQWVRAEETALAVRWTLTGQPQRYDWSAVLAISAAVVFQKREEKLYHLRDRPGVKGRVDLEPELETRDLSRDVAMATISLRGVGDEPVSLRLRAPELEYATILGDDVEDNAFASFCLLLARIGSRATHAVIAPETLELLAATAAHRHLPKEPRFASEEQFDAYAHWLLLTQEA